MLIAFLWHSIPRSTKIARACTPEICDLANDDLCAFNGIHFAEHFQSKKNLIFLRLKLTMKIHIEHSLAQAAIEKNNRFNLKRLR